MNESRNVECDISSVLQEVRGTNRYLTLKTRLHIQQFNIHLIVKCIRGKGKAQFHLWITGVSSGEPWRSL